MHAGTFEVTSITHSDDQCANDPSVKFATNCLTSYLGQIRGSVFGGCGMKASLKPNMANACVASSRASRSDVLQAFNAALTSKSTRARYEPDTVRNGCLSAR